MRSRTSYLHVQLPKTDMHGTAYSAKYLLQLGTAKHHYLPTLPGCPLL